MPVIGRRAIPALRLHLPDKLKKFIAEFLFRNKILFFFSFHNFHFFNCETFFKPNPTGTRPAFVRAVPAESNYYNKIEKKMIVCRIPITKQNPASQTSPLERGRGCVTPVHSHLKPKTSTEAQQTPPQKHLIPNLAPHRNTPLHPLSRGETNTLKHLIPNKKAVSQNSPLERGWGCVTSEHSHLKPKQPPETNKQHLKNTSSQTSPPTVTHPFIPSQEGKQTQQSTNYQTENSISKLPSREGQGVCHVRA